MVFGRFTTLPIHGFGFHFRGHNLLRSWHLTETGKCYMKRKCILEVRFARDRADVYEGGMLNEFMTALGGLGYESPVARVPPFG
jgi:hypothetical protein